MSTISVRLPDSLHQLVRQLSQQDRISINQFISSAVAEKISALATEKYLEERAKRGDAQKFRTALSAVPDIEPAPFDQKSSP